MNKLSIFVFVVIFSTISFADVYPEDVSSFRQGFYQGSATGLWTGGGDNELVDFGESGETLETAYSLDIIMGVGKDWQVESQLQYKNREMKSGSEGGIPEGKSRGHLSNIQFGATKSIYKKAKTSGEFSLHYSHPGRSGNSEKPADSPDSFLALNKGAQRFILQSRNHYQFTSKISLDYTVGYIYRLGDPADQFTIDLISSYALSKKLYLGFGMKYLNTLGGIDVSSSEFSEEGSSRRGGAGGSSEVNAFSILREVSLSSALTIGYRLKNNIFLDGFYSEVLEGENRDKAKTLGLGVTFYSF
jgi:hypothetical protein